VDVDVFPRESGNTLAVTMPIGFKPTFTGQKTIWLAARDLNGENNTGWQTVGSWAAQ
jgi:hypothetical protein